MENRNFNLEERNVNRVPVKTAEPDCGLSKTPVNIHENQTADQILTTENEKGLSEAETEWLTRFHDLFF